jgi:hypothetical protein
MTTAERNAILAIAPNKYLNSNTTSEITMHHGSENEVITNSKPSKFKNITNIEIVGLLVTIHCIILLLASLHRLTRAVSPRRSEREIEVTCALLIGCLAAIVVMRLYASTSHRCSARFIRN